MYISAFLRGFLSGYDSVILLHRVADQELLALAQIVASVKHGLWFVFGLWEAGFMLKNDRYYEPVCKLAFKALLAYD